jgi:hypothetical protein
MNFARSKAQSRLRRPTTMVDRSRFPRYTGVVLAALTAIALTGLAPGIASAQPSALANTAATPASAGSVPRPDHVVVVVEENHSYSDVIGNSAAPYINTLAGQGASFTQSFAITHPSEPNYLALFSGSTQGLSDDSCPHTFSGANLGQELRGGGFGFTGYSETMPSAGYTGCTSGSYARKHNPWVNFSNVPTSANQPFTAFPTDYSTLPTLSFVIPNLRNDMHDGTVAQGDTWLHNNIDGYAQWAKAHNSVLVVTWDEDDNSAGNQVPTIITGAGVTPGSYAETINHYSVLRTLEDAYGLPAAGASATATPITDIWSSSPTGTVTVTNPGTQSGTVGTSSSLQISAADTAGGTLTYTAANLPAGLSINPATGLISGTPTSAGSATVTVTVTDSTGPAGSTSFTWTVTGPGGTCTATQLLGNPGFDTGTPAPWSTTAVITNSGSQPAHSGGWAAWLDGHGSTHTDTLSQTVTLPTGCATYRLGFWLHIDTAETTTTKAYDTLKAQILNSSGTVLSTVATYSNLNAAPGYTQHTADLSAYAGQTVTLRFTGAEDFTLQTSFVLDDTSLALS